MYAISEFIHIACSGTHLHFQMAAIWSSHPASPYSPVLIYSEYDRSDIMSRDRYNLNPGGYIIQHGSDLKKMGRDCARSIVRSRKPELLH